MTTAALETETVVLIPLAQCHKSPSQPRRRDDKKLDEDFVASIRQTGVIQPIVVRPGKAGDFEIVFGHRRHTGSVIAKRETIPAIVRLMSDDEVFEAQLIENVHRQDMHPLDEADGFKRMIDGGRRTVQQIAEKVGRPVTYVAQRLRLCELGKEARAALDTDKINLGTAVLIARIPPSLQAEALRSIQGWWTAAQVKRELDASYFLRLDRAPFDISDAKLVPEAGACTACPKRTGQQRELFPDAARADLCTDRVCYRGKLDAVWQIRLKQAKAGGQAVLEGQAAQKALQYNGGYKQLDAEEWSPTGTKHVKVRSLFGKSLPPITLARDDRTGEITELVKSAEVDKLLKRRTVSGGGDKWREQQRRDEAKNRRRAAAVDLTVTDAISRVDRLGPAPLMRLLAEALIEGISDETGRRIVMRRGLDGGKGSSGSYESRRKLTACLKGLTKPADVLGLAFEVALRQFAPEKWSPARPTWATTLKSLGVNFAAIEKRVAAEAAAKKKAKKAKTSVKKRAAR